MNAGVGSISSLKQYIDSPPISNPNVVKDILKNILEDISKGLNIRDNKDNIVTLSTFLEKHVFQHLNVPKVRSRYKKIISFIFEVKEEDVYAPAIHRFAYHGDFKRVISLMRLAPQKFNFECKKFKVGTPLTCASHKDSKKNPDIIQYLGMFDNLSKTLNKIKLKRLIDIRCKKGTPPPDLNRNEGLVQTLYQAKLPIIGSINMQNVTYHFTRTFTCDTNNLSKRPLIFCFVEKGNALYPRIFWLSQSQAIWRRLDKLFPKWIGKSMRGEQSLAAPILLSMCFYQTHEATKDKDGKSHNLPVDLAETLLKYVVDWSNNEVRRKDLGWIRKGKKYKLQVKKDPTSDPVTIETEAEADSDKRPEAKSLGPKKLYPHPEFNDCLEDESKPNFTKRFPEDLEYTGKTIISPKYGTLRAEVFRSVDESIRYLFFKQEKDVNNKITNHIFLAATEIVATPITKLGLKKEWVDSKNLTLPLVEYPQQFFDDSPEYRDRFWSKADKEKLVKKLPQDYVSTWNYLRQMPFIIDYYAKIHESAPPSEI